MSRTGRSITALAAIAMLVLGACGASDGDGVAAGQRPKLPAVAGGATAKDSAAAAGVSAESMLFPARAVTYRLAAGTRAPANSAPAYRLERGDIDEGTTRRMASAFGLTGAAERGDGGAFVVRAGAAQFQVDGGTVASWSYLRDANGSVSSDVAVACAPDGSCPEPSPPPPVPGLPSAAEAETKARALLDRAGVDVDDADVQTQPDESQSRTVMFTPKVDGRPVVGLVTTVTFGERGRVDYANGYLGRFEQVGDYPLVSMQEAVKRLGSGFGGGGGPRALADDATAAAESGSGGGVAGSTGSAGATDAAPPTKGGPDTPVDPVAPGEPPAPSDPPVTIEPPAPPVTQPPEIVEITGAKVVLMLAYPTCPDDPAYLVPAFAFEPERAGPVVAVQDESLAGVAGAADERAIVECPGVKPEPEPLGRPEPAPLPPEASPDPAPSSAVRP